MKKREEEGRYRHRQDVWWGDQVRERLVRDGHREGSDRILREDQVCDKYCEQCCEWS